jgi:hypothetical protein
MNCNILFGTVALLLATATVAAAPGKDKKAAAAPAPATAEATVRAKCDNPGEKYCYCTGGCLRPRTCEAKCDEQDVSKQHDSAKPLPESSKDTKKALKGLGSVRVEALMRGDGCLWDCLHELRNCLHVCGDGKCRHECAAEYGACKMGCGNDE